MSIYQSHYKCVPHRKIYILQHSLTKLELQIPDLQLLAFCNVNKIFDS